MAKIKLADVVDDKQYRVALKRPIKVGRTWLRPGDGVTLSGTTLKERADDVADILGLAD